MTEDGSVAQFCTYARLGSLELPLAGDLMDAWENPASFFLMDGESTHCHTVVEQPIAVRSSLNERAYVDTSTLWLAESGSCKPVAFVNHP